MMFGGGVRDVQVLGLGEQVERVGVERRLVRALWRVQVAVADMRVQSVHDAYCRQRRIVITLEGVKRT